jgi:hypothetical protein
MGAHGCFPNNESEVVQPQPPSSGPSQNKTKIDEPTSQNIEKP